jgi:hypothetical protein
VSVLGFGYTSRDIHSHSSLCRGCVRTTILAEYADVIPIEVMEPLALFELVELLTEAMPAFGDRISEITAWTVDDEGHGLRCQRCNTWIRQPATIREARHAPDLSWAYPPPRRLRRPVPLAELGIELVPVTRDYVRAVHVHKDGYYIGTLTLYPHGWHADADDPYDTPQLAAARERHRDDALEVLLRTVKQRARDSALAIRGYRQRGMDLYADLLTRRLAAVPRDRAIPAPLRGDPS